MVLVLEFGLLFESAVHFFRCSSKFIFNLAAVQESFICGSALSNLLTVEMVMWNLVQIVFFDVPLLSSLNI